MLAHAIAKENVAALREALSALGLVVAEVDRDLRYVWIDNPHPDFDPRTVVGRRDDELIPENEAADIMSLKKEVLAGGAPRSRLLFFDRSDGRHLYNISAVPVRDGRGRIAGVVTAAVDISAPPNVLR